MAKPNVAALATKLIRQEKTAEEIYDSLIESGVAPCVAREWSNEPARRQRRREQMRAKSYHPVTAGKGTANRRILWTKIENGREISLHATKGYRDRRP